MKLFLDWSDYQNAGMGDAYADIPKKGGDFAKAVASCIGSKQCETHTKGVMCPSFRVTGNPTLSTGGRVKLLKTALNAINDDNALFDAQLVEAMNECVSCKGCKRECENEVDMALIKAEYLAQFNQTNGVPLRRKLFANLPKLVRFPVLKQLVTWRNHSPFIAKMTETFLNISAKAPLPVPENQTLSNTEKFTQQSADSTREVVLFADTFNRNFNPQVVEAAVNLLKKAGYHVEIASSEDKNNSPLCCGRTYFSNGMISEAKNQATRLLQALEPHIDAGRWIIGLESSCILSLRDEYLKLDLGDAAKKLAERVLLLEEFIAREQTAKRWILPFKVSNERMLVHGHCHQKAVGAMKAMRKVLKTVEGLDFEFIESSCCGMAGHFGLEAEHYEHSQAMAEQALFPKLRSEPQVGIITNGFSCQQQIGNGGFNKPLHIAEVLYAATGEL